MNNVTNVTNVTHVAYNLADMSMLTAKVRLKWAPVLVLVAVLFGSLLAAPASAASTTSPFRDKLLYVDPFSQAAAWAKSGPTANRAAITEIAQTSQAIWVSDFGGLAGQAPTVLADVAAKKSYPVIVVYAIPNRDCGHYSSGGATPAQYRDGIRLLAKLLANTDAAIVVEPDGLSASSCLNAAAKKERIELIKFAATELAKNKRLAVYLDIGHNKWLTPQEAADLLTSAGVDKVRGFSLNVSNFYYTADEIEYGLKVSNLIGGKHFVIDTSRNGRGPLPVTEVESWCNPHGRALGQAPTANTAHERVDAYLWIKRPGESDGTCRGGGHSGTWYDARAIEMVTNRQLDSKPVAVATTAPKKVTKLKLSSLSKWKVSAAARQRGVTHR